MILGDKNNSMEFSTFTYQGAEISYSVYGSGKPLMLLHGFGEDSSVWRHQVKALSGECSLLVPDLPGSGKSVSEKAIALTAEIDTMADCMAALVRHVFEGTNGVAVLGHSMGGYITLALEQRHTALINAFGLVHSTAFADTAEKKETRRKAIAFIQKNGSLEFLKTAVPGLFGDAFKAAHPEQVEALIAAGKDFEPAALINYYEAMMARPERTGVLQGSAKPVLFILGTEDKAAPMNDVLKQSYMPQVSYLTILDGAGHMGMWEQPVKVNNAILNFMRTLE